MKHGSSNNRRQRGRGNTNRHGAPQRNHVYDSNGPDVRIRGTAHQVAEKYLALAKDASSVGDIVIAENYYQHAEHYLRLINEMNDAVKVQQEAKAVADNHGNQKEDDLGLPRSIVGNDVQAQPAQQEAMTE